MRPSDRVVFWKGETRERDSGLTLVRWGGQTTRAAPSSTGRRVRRGEERRGGALLSGDIVQVTPDRYLKAIRG